jgi:hypothetical protein
LLACCIPRLHQKQEHIAPKKKVICHFVWSTIIALFDEHTNNSSNTYGGLLGPKSTNNNSVTDFSNPHWIMSALHRFDELCACLWLY